MRALLLFGFLLFSLAASGQLLLQLEKTGSARTRKFFIGQELQYRLQDERSWDRGEIVNILPERQLIVFENGYQPIAGIEAIRKKQGWSQPLGAQWIVFGASWTLFSLGAAIADPDDPYSWSDVGVGVSSITFGFAFQQVFRFRTFRIGKKYRLRPLDLRVGREN